MFVQSIVAMLNTGINLVKKGNYLYIDNSKTNNTPTYYTIEQSVSCGSPRLGTSYFKSGHYKVETEKFEKMELITEFKMISAEEYSKYAAVETDMKEFYTNISYKFVLGENGYIAYFNETEVINYFEETFGNTANDVFVLTSITYKVSSYDENGVLLSSKSMLLNNILDQS